MLIINIPDKCVSEQRYILDIMLTDFLGIKIDIAVYDEPYIKITSKDNNVCLSLNADFFYQVHHAWLKTESMPQLPLQQWSPSNDSIAANLVEPNVPVLYGQPGLVKNAQHWHLNLDIFGSAFFMLSRYEELVTQDRDEHDRFPATASIAYKANFLDRPIVNEYLEILWTCLSELWPGLQRKKRTFRKFISCDVDHPFDLVGYSLKSREISLHYIL